MLSSYDNEEVRAIFQHYNIVPIRSSSGMRAAEAEIRANGLKRTINREILVLNYDPPATADTKEEEPLERADRQVKMFEKRLDYLAH